MELPVEISCQDARDLLVADSEMLLLDCRENEEFNIAHLDGARLLPMSEIASRLKELEPAREKRIIVYCHHGMRSLQVTNWLRQQGFSRAQSMIGGIDQWALAIDPATPRY